MKSSEHAERLMRARVSLILDEPFFGSLMMHLKLAEDRACKTFSTNGRHLFYNPKFMDTLSDAQLKTVLVHEVMHCALLHPFRRGDRDLRKFNIAADYAINNFLDNYNKQATAKGGAEPFPVEGLGLVDHQYDSLSAEEIYTRLIDPPPSGGGGGGGQAPGPGQPDPSDPSDPSDQNAPPDSPPSSPGEFTDGGTTQADLDEKESNWKVAVQQAAEAAKSQGRLPAGMERFVKDLVDPAVHWREVLRNFITAFAKDDYSWARPNRRYASAGVMLPSLHSPRMGRIAVAIDTSGSIGQEELTIFLSEIRSILFDCRPEKLILLQCDAQVHEYRELDPFDDVNVEMKGGGGTDFCPVFEALDGGLDLSTINPQLSTCSEPPVCLVYLTDLMGSFPKHEPAYPVLWACITEEQAPFGITLPIK